MVRMCLLVSMVLLTLAAAAVHGVEPNSIAAFMPEDSPACAAWRAEYLAKKATRIDLFVDLLASDGRVNSLHAETVAAEQIYQAALKDFQFCLKKYGANSKLTKDAQAFLSASATGQADARSAEQAELAVNRDLRNRIRAITQQIEQLAVILEANCGGTNGQ